MSLFKKNIIPPLLRYSVCLTFICTPAFASEPIVIADDKDIITFSLENDLFAGTDDGYTNGVRFSYLSSEERVPDWLDSASRLLPFFDNEGQKRFGFAAGQAMYAPDDLRQKQLITDDRPYAGFLYGSVGLISDQKTRYDNLQFTIGIVGPASLAAETQDFVHDTIGSIDPQGWDNQLKNEPGFILTYERKWRRTLLDSQDGFGIDLTPHVGLNLGNIHTDVTIGGAFRFGYDLQTDYGPPLIRPNLPGTDFFKPKGDFGWYGFAGFEGRGVAHNIFLDGNTFTDSHSVDKKHFVGGIQVGMAVTIYQARLAYTHVFRTKEFEGQNNADEFGSLSLSLRF